METPKFTSGPWEADALIVYQDSGIQGHICAMAPFFNDPVKEANAKLIAAAPELYEACQAALTELQQYIPVTDVNVLNKVANAIRKATT